MCKRLKEYRKQFHGEKTRMKQACLILLFVAYFCPSVCSLTTFQQQFLDVHNEKRRIVNPTAANMRELKWSDELATVAQNYANKCVSGHNPNKYDKAESFKRVGENLYYSKDEATPRKAVEFWDNEKNSYDFGTNNCTHEKTCGHYTQVVWAETEYVGCAVAFCDPLIREGWSSGYFYVCNYGERGNMNGDRPYIHVIGSTCSQCPSGYSCNNGLCSK
nr:peptidase inhibitor 16-like [Crassostrea gigas]